MFLLTQWEIAAVGEHAPKPLEETEAEIAEPEGTEDYLSRGGPAVN